MVNVQFEEDPYYNSYISAQRKIFEKPSTSPIINNLIEKKLFKSEKQAGITLLVGMGVLLIVVGVLFHKFVLTTPTIDTSKGFVPAITQ